ncbi:DUF5724 domain-containing protein [Paenibacillus rhizoplanae]
MEIIAEYLGWEGLRSAAWYFHAHINESFSAEKKRRWWRITRRSRRRNSTTAPSM